MGDWVAYIMVAFGCACMVLYMWIAWLDWWPGYKEARHLQKVRRTAEEGTVNALERWNDELLAEVQRLTKQHADEWAKLRGLLTAMGRQGPALEMMARIEADRKQEP